MLHPVILQEVGRERRQDMLREAETRRLANKAKATRTPSYVRVIVELVGPPFMPKVQVQRVPVQIKPLLEGNGFGNGMSR